MPDLSKQQLLDLAAEKLSDAKLLQSNNRTGNANYLAGYAIELLLKAAARSTVFIGKGQISTPRMCFGRPPDVSFVASRMDVLLIAAVAENGVIGSGNALPWRLRSDMQHFRAFTMGKPVIMGRKTFLSLGKPLKGRTTIVVSRGREFAASGAVVAPNLDAAVAAARGDALRRQADAIIVAGGASRLVITEVHRAVAGDAHFPAIAPAVWRETSREEHAAAAGDDSAFAFVTYQRQSAAAASNDPANASG
jgi:dihydrofolate reductase